MNRDDERPAIPDAYGAAPESLSVPTPMAILRRDTLRTLAAVRLSVQRRTLTVISGPNAGQLFVLSSREHILGRGEVADLQVVDPDVSRTHARLVLGDDGHTDVQDLGSTNGTFVAGERISRARLAPGDRLQCGPNVVLRFALTDDVEEELHRRMYQSSSRDVLTQAFNRRYFIDRLVGEVAHARRHHLALSLLKLDLDGFQRVNDASSPVVGDIVLRAVAARVSRTIRVEDVFARWEGDEFVILARSTELSDATRLAERVRAAIAGVEVPADGTPLRVSASIGVASLAELRLDEKPAALLAVADRRLATAKAGGRDRVHAEG